MDKSTFNLIKKITEYKGRTQNTKVQVWKKAELVIINLVQAKAFPNEIKTLKTKNAVAKTKVSKLYTLSPFLDEEGILGGHLSHAVLHPHISSIQQYY